MTTDEMIERYLLATVTAVATLYAKDLYSHTLIIMYSTIDTVGLLDAPASQTNSSRNTFKAWVDKYVVPDSRVEFTSVDLWAARCAVLHTHTSESNLSNSGQAKQLQYYGGDKDSEAAHKFVTVTKSVLCGQHIPVHLGDLSEVFFASLKAFASDLSANCKSNPAFNDRLRNVLQMHPMESAL